MISFGREFHSLIVLGKNENLNGVLGCLQNLAGTGLCLVMEARTEIQRLEKSLFSAAALLYDRPAVLELHSSSYQKSARK